VTATERATITATLLQLSQAFLAGVATITCGQVFLFSVHEGVEDALQGHSVYFIMWYRQTATVSRHTNPAQDSRPNHIPFP
jgi:hypothetical protein